MSLLKVENLRLFYQVGKHHVRAVDGLSFEIERPGESLAIIGESGCGKTSLGRAILRLPPTAVSEFSGHVLLRGEDLLALSEAEFARRIRWKQISWVPQEVANVLNPMYSIENQIEETLRAHGVSNRKQEMRTLLQMVGLSHNDAKKIPSELSGGMKQRAVIAVALALRPPLVVLDEPTSALDVSIQGQIIQLLRELKRRLSLSYLFITHDIALAASLCEYIAVVYAGKIVERGRTGEVLAHPLHPYTVKLLSCVPVLEPGRVIDFIPGEPPDLKSPPPGCRFHPRCHIAEIGLCNAKEPLVEEKEPGHFVACHKA